MKHAHRAEQPHRDARAFRFFKHCAERNQQRFDVSPFDISTCGAGEDQFESGAVPAFHASNGSGFRYHVPALFAANATQRVREVGGQENARAAACAGCQAAWKAGDIRYIKWHSILDSRTSIGCAVRAGKLYTFEFQPVNHDVSMTGRRHVTLNAWRFS